MRISLRTAWSKQIIGEYQSPVVPRVGEHVNLAEALPHTGGLLRVIDVVYHAQNTDRESNSVDLEVTAVDDSARKYIGELLYRVA